jgi:PIN domain nuclease of toxin-antitoxin system
LTMRLLLDTHIFLWIADDSSRLNSKARELVDSASEVFVSSATIWEVAVKARIGKMIVDPDELLLEIDKCGFQELLVSGRHAVGVARLPLIHNDPFDRLLVAQGISEKMHLLTADARLAEYSELVIVI